MDNNEWNPFSQVLACGDLLAEILGWLHPLEALGRFSLVSKQAGALCWSLAPNIEISFQSEEFHRNISNLNYLIDWILPLTGNRLRRFSAPHVRFLTKKHLQHLRFSCPNLTSLGINLCNLVSSQQELEHLSEIFQRLTHLRLHANGDYWYPSKFSDEEDYDEEEAGDEDEEEEAEELWFDFGASQTLSEEELEEEIEGEGEEKVEEDGEELESDGSEEGEESEITPLDTWAASLAAFVNLTELEITGKELRDPSNFFVIGNLEWSTLLSALGSPRLKRISLPFGIEGLNLLLEFEDLERIDLPVLGAVFDLEVFWSDYPALRSASKNLKFRIYEDGKPILLHLLSVYKHSRIITELTELGAAFFVSEEVIVHCLQSGIHDAIFGMCSLLLCEEAKGHFPPTSEILQRVDCLALLKQFLNPCMGDSEQVDVLLQVISAGLETSTATPSPKDITLSTIAAKQTNLLWVLILDPPIDEDIVKTLLRRHVLGHAESLRERDGDGMSLAHLATSPEAIGMLKSVFGDVVSQLFYTDVRNSAGQLPLEYLLENNHKQAAVEIMRWMEPPQLSMEYQSITTKVIKTFLALATTGECSRSWYSHFMRAVNIPALQALQKSP
eukprot:TRINITY_DN5719_c0_g1_i1.p1 TRINITY_DN5719_c0_g1~~TRINITY_DN5719_c0_g1_i1.p1  ORF type:complete len:626 (+),score=94.59 TRINITY_DN5719_c0_g1_i1:38-1879(+)